MNIDRTPVHIVGAGPAGLAAAIAVAQSGRQAVVHERARGVGSRFHDEFQGLENWTTDEDVLDELVSFGLEIDFDHTPFRETVIFDPSGHPHRYASPKPLYYLVRRGPGAGTLDTALEAQALAYGVEIRFGDARPHAPDGGIVAAGPRGPDAIAVGYVFDTDAADAACGAVGDHLAAKGYAYLLAATLPSSVVLTAPRTSARGCASTTPHRQRAACCTAGRTAPSVRAAPRPSV